MILPMTICYKLEFRILYPSLSSILGQYFALIGSEQMHSVGCVLESLFLFVSWDAECLFGILSGSFTFVTLNYAIVLVSIH
jgi:hypothetical protein